MLDKKTKDQLIQFLEDAQLDRVGCFAYSPVEGATANALPDLPPESVREDRRRWLMQVQEDIYFRAETQWIALPRWANFYIRLGARLASLQADKRTIAVVVPPVRDFAAAFAAAGAVVSRSCVRLDASDLDDIYGSLDLDVLSSSNPS